MASGVSPIFFATLPMRIASLLSSRMYALEYSPESSPLFLGSPAVRLSACTLKGHGQAQRKRGDQGNKYEGGSKISLSVCASGNVTTCTAHRSCAWDTKTPCASGPWRASQIVLPQQKD